MVKIAILGPDNFIDVMRFKSEIDSIISKTKKLDMIITGSTKGIGNMANLYAQGKHIERTTYPIALSYGDRLCDMIASKTRDERIVNQSDILILFIDNTTQFDYIFNLSHQKCKKIHLVNLCSDTIGHHVETHRPYILQ
jgi:Ran GTPase-activating protein (RanGAP) involved in mRNA processing and transport